MKCERLEAYPPSIAAADLAIANLPSGVAQAAIKAGLPALSAMQFVGASLGGDPSARPKVAGVTPATLLQRRLLSRPYLPTPSEMSGSPMRPSVVQPSFVRPPTTRAEKELSGQILVTLFLRPVGDKMTVHVESPLEDDKLREHIMHQDMESRTLKNKI
jgi:hypothetical protein